MIMLRLDYFLARTLAGFACVFFPFTRCHVRQTCLRRIRFDKEAHMSRNMTIARTTTVEFLQRVDGSWREESWCLDDPSKTLWHEDVGREDAAAAPAAANVGTRALKGVWCPPLSVSLSSHSLSDGWGEAGRQQPPQQAELGRQRWKLRSSGLS